jgi:hypothetical protein
MRESGMPRNRPWVRILRVWSELTERLITTIGRPPGTAVDAPILRECSVAYDMNSNVVTAAGSMLVINVS